MNKKTGKEGGSQKITPPRSCRDSLISSFTRIQTIYESYDIQLFPDIQFNFH